MKQQFLENRRAFLQRGVNLMRNYSIGYRFTILRPSASEIWKIIGNCTYKNELFFSFPFVSLFRPQSLYYDLFFHAHCVIRCTKIDSTHGISPLSAFALKSHARDAIPIRDSRIWSRGRLRLYGAKGAPCDKHAHTRVRSLTRTRATYSLDSREWA